MTTRRSCATSVGRGFGIRDGNGIVFINHDGTVNPSGFLPIPLGNVRERTPSWTCTATTRSCAACATRQGFKGRCGACEYVAGLRRLAGPRLRVDRRPARVGPAVPVRPVRHGCRAVRHGAEAARPMSVLVIGGGITGLAAARALARDGVPVTLAEAGPRLGGKIAHGARSDGFVARDGPGLVPRHAAGGGDAVPRAGPGRRARRDDATRGPSTSATAASWCRCPRAWASSCRRRLPFARTRLFSWPEKIRAGPTSCCRAGSTAGTSRSGRSCGAGSGAAGGPAGRPARRRGLRDAVDELSLLTPSCRSSASTSATTGASSSPAWPRAGEPGHGRRVRPRRHGHRRRRPGGAARERRRHPARRSSAWPAGMGSLVDALGDGDPGAPGAEIRLRHAASSALERAAARHDGAPRRRDEPGTGGGDPGRPGRRSPRGLLEAEVPGRGGRDPLHPPRLDRRGHPRLPRRGAGRGPLRRPRVPRRRRRAAGLRGLHLHVVEVGRPGSRRHDPPARVPARALGRAPGPRPTTRSSPPSTRTWRRRSASGRRRSCRLVARWREAMPRYTVGHLERVAAAERALADRPEIVLAGAAFHGVGVPDCVARGRAAARSVLAMVGASDREAAVA